MASVTVTFNDADPGLNGPEVDIRLEFGESGIEEGSPAHLMATMMLRAVADSLETSDLRVETSEVPNG